MVQGLNPAERRLAWLVVAGAALGLIWNSVPELQPPPPPVTIERGGLAPDSSGAPPLNDTAAPDVYDIVGTTANEPVDLLTADAGQLESLPGIGPVLARRIMEWRARQSGTWSLDDLLEVPGIGPVTLELFRSRVLVGRPADEVVPARSHEPPQGGECR